MKAKKWMLLQLFAEGGDGGSTGGDGNAAASASGETGVAAEHQRLRELGGPEEKLRKRAQRQAAKLPEGAVRTAPKQAQEQKPQEQVATATENPTEEKTESHSPARMSWDEIKADPEYNKEIQAIVQARLKSAKGAEETLAKMAPALELLARKHGQDPANMDYDALAKAISDDDAYYEDKALEMGVSLETAKRMDQQEREDARKKREETRNLEEQKLRTHFKSLEQQGEALKKVFPSFDLRTELQNPVFARMTSPNVGVSVEDAYHAVHRKEIMTAGMQVTAQRTKEQISNAIQAGSRRPDENGTSGQSPSVTTFDYSKASKEQRDALKREIYAAKARGEKLYPGR